MINCLSWALSGCDGYFDMDEVYCENEEVYRDPEWMPYDWEVRIMASNKIQIATNESDDYIVLHYEDFSERDIELIMMIGLISWNI